MRPALDGTPALPNFPQILCSGDDWAHLCAGDVFGLGNFIYQSLGMRPTPQLSGYRVPGADGLYLSGPFTHPGGGINGGGRPVAIRIMEDLGIDSSKVLKI